MGHFCEQRLQRSNAALANSNDEEWSARRRHAPTTLRRRLTVSQCSTVFSQTTYRSCALVAHSRLRSWKCTMVERSPRQLR